jgi:hypothetical protein
MSDDQNTGGTPPPSAKDQSQQTPPAANQAPAQNPSTPPFADTPEAHESNVPDPSSPRTAATSADTNADAAKAELNAKGADEAGVTSTDLDNGDVLFESPDFSVLVKSSNSAPVVVIRKVGTVGEELALGAGTLKGLLSVLNQANRRVKSRQAGLITSPVQCPGSKRTDPS